MFSQFARRIAAIIFGGGLLLASSMLLAPAANAAPVSGAAKCPYNAPITTTTTLKLSPSSVAKGQSFTATATVTASAGPVPTGTVVFTYGGHTKTGTLVGGKASVTFKATTSGAVRAVYQGLCAGGQAAVGSSVSGPVVLGISGSRGHGGGSGNGGSGTVAGTSAGIGGLAATGVNSQTELLGALGAGLVVVGGLALIVHRRRVEA